MSILHADQGWSLSEVFRFFKDEPNMKNQRII
jgi:hypothetical protein